MGIQYDFFEKNEIKKTEAPVECASVFLILDKIKKNAGNGT